MPGTSGHRWLIAAAMLAALVAVVLLSGRGDPRAATRRVPPPALKIERHGLIANLDGYLTGPQAGDAEKIARDYIATQRDVLGLSRSGLRTLHVRKRIVSPARVTYLRFDQRDRGIPVYGGGLDAAIAHDGRVVRVFGKPVSDVRAPRGRPKLTAGEAARTAAKAIHAKPSGNAELVLLPRLGTDAYGWRVDVDAHDVVLDDAHGRVVSSRSLRKSGALLRVHLNHPGAAVGGTAALEDVGGDLTAIDKLEGPTAHAYADLDAGDDADPGEEVAPSGPAEWDYPREVVSSPASLCPFGCTWNHLVANSWRGTNDENVKQAATQGFFFVTRFLDHLAEANIGFSDANDGFGASDPVQVEVLDGANSNNAGFPADVNNAGFNSTKDGVPPHLETYLWRPVGSALLADVNGGDDAGIVYHEVTHGLSTRLITDSGGIEALNYSQAGALGEGWSDFMALSYLVSSGLRADTAADGELDIAPYVSGGGGFSRHEPPDCPVTSPAEACGGTPAGQGGYTYADYGKVLASGPEPHADGEMWAQTLWDIRNALGAATTERLVVEAMRLTPAEPSFLDARDALLQAEAVTFGGAHRAALWQVFAQRGMGYFASSIDGNDEDPVADFTLPPDPSDPTGSLSGTVTDAATGQAVAGATVSIGGHDSGFPFSQTATTDASGNYSFSSLALGTYPELVVASPRYERLVSTNVTILAGAQTRSFKPRRNWAWAGTGGSAVQVGTHYVDCPGEGALDGDFNSGWCQDTPGTLQFILPQAVNVTQIAIDPRARSHDQRLSMKASAGAYTVETAQSVGGNPGPWRLVKSGTFTKADDGHLNALDPVPSQHFATRYVRVTVSSPQDTSAVIGLAEVQVYAVANQRPIAALSHTPDAPRTDEPVTFSAAGSSDPDGTITAYDWDLDGNGTFETHTGTTSQVTKTYGDPVDITARVRVTDDDNDTRIATEPLSVMGTGRIYGLGTLGGDESAAGRINNIGQVTAEADTTPGGPSLHAARWEAGTLSDLGSTSTRSRGLAINSNGQSVGNSFASGTDNHATLFPAPGTPPIDLGTLGGPESIAEGINDAGTVVGWAQIGTPEKPRRAFVRTAGGPLTSLGTFDASPGANDKSDAWDINTAGHVVGWAQGNGVADPNYHAFLWTGSGALVDLGTTGGRWSIATAINDSDMVGGYSEPSSLAGFHAWIRTPAGVRRDLGTFGGAESVVRDIDNKGRVVGYAQKLDGNYAAFLFKNNTLIDLNRLLPPQSGWQLLSANGINEADQISGYGLHNGKTEGFMLDLGACRICVEDVKLEHQDVPTGAWKRVPSSGTYDGNTVRVTATLQNTSSQAQAFNVRFVDTHSGAELPGSAAPESLDPGETKTVSYDWDTDGLAWDGGLPASDRGVRVKLTVGPNVLDERVHTVKIKPRPVFLVHGLWSDASTWSAYPAFMQAAHPDWEVIPVTGMDTGQQLSLSHMPNTIFENAQVLDNAITSYRDAHDAQRIDLVGHSMGGLISRMWINSFMPDPGAGRPMARHLIQLGTPNMGSACADVLFRADTVELRTTVAQEFNQLVTNRKGVRFSVAVGTPLPFTCVDPTTGDSVVSQTSAEWEIADHVTNGLLHTAMTGDAALFTDFVKPRLDGAVTVDPPPARRRIAAVAPAPPELTDGDAFTLGAGATRDFTATVTDATRVGFALAAPAGVAAQLIAPDQSVAAEIPAGNSEFIRSGGVSSPAVGTWTLHLTNTGAAAPVSASVFENGSALTLAMDGGAIDFRRRSMMHATLVGGTGTVTATLRKADGTTQSLRLVDDGTGGDVTAGDGVYSGRSGALSAGRWLIIGQADLPGGRRRMTTGDLNVPAATPAAPTPGALGGRIAYSRTQGSYKHIWTLAAAGGTPRRITDGSVLDETPAWSPDGTKIAFARKTTGSFDLWIVGADGSGLTQVTSTADDDTNPTWSPDGTKLAFARANDIWTVATGGGSLTQVTVDGAAADDNRPSWSPDGTTIAFDRNVANAVDIATVPAAGGATRIVLAAPNQQTAPNWSADGRELLYSDNVAGLGVVDASSGGVAPVRAQGGNGVWSPAADRVVYQFGSDLQIAPADGSAGTPLMSDTPVQADPDWTAATIEPPAVVPACPDTSAQSGRTGERQAFVTLPCADRDELPITISIVKQPLHGTLGAVQGTPPNSSVVYTPAAGYDGPDTFTYKATNAVGDSAAGTASITVRPQATDDPYVDRTFGVQGHVLTSLSAGGDSAQAVAVQSDGKIVVAGASAGKTVVLRYLPDGTLDPDYGTAGVAATLPGNPSLWPAGVAIDSKGRAVVVGYFFSNTSPMVARYTPAGALDTTFSGDGVQQLGSPLRIFYDVAIAPGDKVVVGGGEYQNTGDPLMMAARLTEAGVPDTTFSGDGFATLTLSTAGGLARAVAVEPDGQVVLAGEAQNYPTSSSILLDTGVGRFNSDGTPDAGFGTNGGWVKSFSTSHDSAHDVMVDGDGRILVLGSTNQVAAPGGEVATLSRLTSAGVPDGSFAGGGTQTYGGPFQVFPAEKPMGLALDSGGSIWAGGYIYPDVDVSWQFAALRFKADGALDTSFSDDGYSTAFGAPSEIGYGAAGQGDKLVIAGAQGSQIALTRFSTTPFAGGGGAHAPVCSDGAVTAYAGETTTLTFSCSDADGDPLTFAAGTPAHGTLADLNASAGTASYQPEAGYLGADDVTFTATDPSTRSSGGHVAIDVITRPPEPTPTPTPSPSGGGGTTGGGTTGGTTGGGSTGGTQTTTTNESGGGRSCVVGTAGCTYPVTCPPEAAGQCNGDASNQTGGHRTAIISAVTPYFKPVKFSIPAGKTKKLALKLTPKGKKQLKRKHKLKTAILVRFSDRSGHKWVRRGTITFRQRKR